MNAPLPTRAEEAREADCASEWRQIERAWRDADLPEWFLGNGGTNHGLYRFVDKVRALSAARVEAKVAVLEAALTLCVNELDWQAEQTKRCGDPNYECPLQDIHKPSDSHAEARADARAALHGGDQ